MILIIIYIVLLVWLILHKKNYKIYVIGDSHKALYEMKDTIILSIPPAVTMHRVGKDGFETLVDVSKIEPGNIILVIFGEIDVRTHIHKQIEKGRPLEEVIDTLSKNYLKECQKLSEITKCRVIIRGVVPPLKDGMHEDTSYPINGSLEDRKLFRRILNEKIETLCNNSNINYLQSMAWAEDENGIMLSDISKDKIHIDLNIENKERALKELDQFKHHFWS